MKDDKTDCGSHLLTESNHSPGGLQGLIYTGIGLRLYGLYLRVVRVMVIRYHAQLVMVCCGPSVCSD